MELNKKRYNDLDTYLKRKFNKKIIKLPLDGGFTCPNRDGTISKKGCIFCSDEGSGEWCQRDVDIKKQLELQKQRLKKPGRDEGYIGYFQNFTATYGPVDKMKKLFLKVLSDNDIVGLFVATRADCLSDEVLEILYQISKKTFLVVEIGMQSVNDATIKLINRGYTHQTFNQGVNKLIDHGINVLVHLIIGLPYENQTDYERAIDYVNSKKIWGIKIHNLYVEKDSRLERFYIQNNLDYAISKDDYIEIVCRLLRLLDKDIIINRLTGDGIKDKISFPKWAKNKAMILSSIDKKLKEEDLRQGDLCKEN